MSDARPPIRDEAALAAYMEAHRPTLLGHIERQLGPDLRGKLEPGDIFQDVFVKARGEFARAGLVVDHPLGLLGRLADECVIDAGRRVRAERRRADREVPGNVPAGDGSRDLIDLLAGSFTTPSQAAVRDERADRLRGAMADLPADHREALRLHHVDGLPVEEVARRLGKTPGATRTLLSRLVKDLGRRLRPGEDDRPVRNRPKSR
ncbi:MAG: sigma-70 family RNA polymerase sigma factor [Gemmataceae bacterium]|nr:sigma-70 family RNA polymerase sigma factor [Gemmataceae bacterium]